MNDLEQRYRYVRASTFDKAQSLLSLETWGGRTLAGPALHPRFFSGFFTSPGPAAESLQALARIAATRYTELTRPSIAGSGGSFGADPVVTADGEKLRFEAFSACGGVYARLDVLPAGIDGGDVGRGTTNVDIGEELRRMLAGVSPSGVLHVSVGAEDITLTDAEATVVERKVPLPTRWLRGFAESQLIASAFDARLELSPTEAQRFVRQAAASRQSGWVVAAGASARTSGRPSAQAVYLAEARRLDSLLPLLRFATQLRAYGPAVSATADSASSGWELELPGMRLILLLSPAVSRGFSGEGAVLDSLADEDVVVDAETVYLSLAYEPHVDIGAISEAVGMTGARVRAALSCLATAGRVGYDLSEAEYFHRDLPYDATAVETMNPRLRAARALVDGGAVTLLDTSLADVTSGERVYRVRKAANGVSCSCAWWTSHRGDRGPCKHVLATQIQRRRRADEEEDGKHADNTAGVATHSGTDRNS